MANNSCYLGNIQISFGGLLQAVSSETEKNMKEVWRTEWCVGWKVGINKDVVLCSNSAFAFLLKPGH